MTDEEKAEEYFNKHKYAHDNRNGKQETIHKKIYLDGLAEGREEKWHDLRRNPNDLPKECQNVLCLCNDIGCKYYCTGHLIYKTWFSNTESKVLRVTAWCELPKFEEK